MARASGTHRWTESRRICESALPLVTAPNGCAPTDHSASCPHNHPRDKTLGDRTSHPGCDNNACGDLGPSVLTVAIPRFTVQCRSIGETTPVTAFVIAAMIAQLQEKHGLAKEKIPVMMSGFRPVSDSLP